MVVITANKILPDYRYGTTQILPDYPDFAPISKSILIGLVLIYSF